MTTNLKRTAQEIIIDGVRQPSKIRNQLEYVLQRWWFRWAERAGSRWLRIESCITPGFPDAVGTNGKDVAFVEFKYIPDVRPRGGWMTRLGVSDDQYDFLSTWPRAFLLARIQHDVILVPGHRLSPKKQSYQWWRDNAAHMQCVPKPYNVRTWSSADPEFYHIVFGTLHQYYAEESNRKMQIQLPEECLSAEK